MSDIERIPSMRKDAKQGVPKRKPRDMAKPMAEAGKTKDAPMITPRVAAPEPEMSVDPEVLLAPTLPQLAEQLAPEPVPEREAEPVASTEPEPEPEPVAATESEPVVESTPEPASAREPAPEPEPWVAAEVESLAASEPQPEPPPDLDQNAPPLTMREMFARVEPAFHEFRDAAYGYPAEHMNDRIGDEGWTRKQMLSHICAWHDLTTDRLLKMATTAQPVPLDRAEDAINNAAARIAIGKSVGEVLKDVEASYARLRRQMLRMTDVDLRLGDGWAAHVIAGNTYHHYAEHMADLAPPVPLPGSGAQR